MNVVYLCLGGNIGDRKKALASAVFLIRERVGEVISQSNLYETEAWGVTNQAAYLNQCICINTSLTAEELIAALLNVEKDLGRVRDVYHAYEPRTVDIDILFFNNLVLNANHLIIPHPRMHLRKFVLIPLMEIAPDLLHPVFDIRVKELLLQTTDNSEVKLYP